MRNETGTPRFIALYLPQYYPIPENDKWYGEGFTEWVNVTKAAPLFPGHYQPKLPADLGFYDLRVRDVRVKQAEMAQQYGIDAFCYWTYWFGNGKKLLNIPIWGVYEDKEISLPFCLGWANHSWEKKTWKQGETNHVIVKQEYMGIEDYRRFFYEYLPVFKDNRYFKVNNRLFFIIYSPLASQDIKDFIKLWRELAKKEGLSDFFFVGEDSACRDKNRILNYGFDAVYDQNVYNIHHEQNSFKKILQFINRRFLKRPTVFKYKDAAKYMVTEDARDENVIPCIVPNWDHSPRSGRNAIILHDCEPRYWEDLCRRAINTVCNKPSDEQLIIIKSWNEWGEGNYLEPDQRYGRGYLEALRNAKEECAGSVDGITE